MKIKELFYNKSGVVLLSTILLSILAFYFATQKDPSSNFREALFAIGSSLIATAFFTIFYNQWFGSFRPELTSDNQQVVK